MIQKRIAHVGLLLLLILSLCACNKNEGNTLLQYASPDSSALSLSEGGWVVKMLTPAEELEPPANISMTLTAQEGKNLTVELTNHGAEEWVYGKYFSVQVLLDNIWYKIPVTSAENWGFIDIAMVLAPDKTQTESYNLDMYGELPKGTYRLVVEGMTAEFEVTENTVADAMSGNQQQEETLPEAMGEEPKATILPTATPQIIIPEPTPSPEPVATQPPTVRLVMVGDMLMHERVMESGLQEDGSYDFDHLFVHVEEQIESADLALVNQETILGGTELGLTGYPCFNSPYELGTAEVETGFDVILHGTNHALDKGKKGAVNCMDFWEEQYPEIAYLGINRSQDAQDNDIYVYEQDGIKLAILNYTYGTNGISTPKDMPYLVNYMDKEKVIADLQLAQELADFTIVCPHWGKEYYLGISSEQKKWTKLFLEYGVDLVIGTHPHVIEPVEWVEDEAGNRMLVYYSLGNFVNGTSGKGNGVMNRCVGGLADVTIGRNEADEVVILEYDAIPLVCHIAEGEEYSVWYLEDYTEELAQENHIRKQDETFSLENCKALVEEVWGE